MSEGIHVLRYGCIRCGEPLRFGEVMDSRGVCPHCGHDSGSTVCDVSRRVVKLVPMRGFKAAIKRALGIGGYRREEAG